MVNLVHHFTSASWNREAFFNLIITGVWQQLKFLVFNVIPWLKKITLHPSIGVSCRQQLLNFFFNVHFDFGLELIFEKLEKFSKIQNSLEIEIEDLTEAIPILFIFKTFKEVIKLFFIMLIYGLRIGILNIKLLN